MNIADIICLWTGRIVIGLTLASFAYWVWHRLLYWPIQDFRSSWKRSEFGLWKKLWLTPGAFMVHFKSNLRYVKMSGGGVTVRRTQ